MEHNRLGYNVLATSLSKITYKGVYFRQVQCLKIMQLKSSHPCNCRSPPCHQCFAPSAWASSGWTYWTIPPFMLCQLCLALSVIPIVLCNLSRYRENVEKEGALSVGSYSDEDGSLLSILNEKLCNYLVSREKGTYNVPTASHHTCLARK